MDPRTLTLTYIKPERIGGTSCSRRCEARVATCQRVGRRRVGEIRIPVGELLSSSAVWVCGQWHALDALATGVRQSRGVSLNLLTQTSVQYCES